MALIKCKMCGGDLTLHQGQSIAECEYCGTRQTVPSADNEKKLLQFERADWLRRNCEFDKAAGVYETIVSEFRQEAEAYWGLVLCKYGIEYVDDPATGKKVPTCHRSSYDSVMDDENLELTLDYADAVARKQYREEAKQLEALRKVIVEVSGKEAPYDIFICYKETDETGDRTLDSVLAQDIYGALTDKGYRVFFSRISLEDKLGLAYEPYIFAALNSAKVMLAVGTDYEYYQAVWVKNEWSRFLKLMEKDKTKHLIPCFKGLDAYDIPKEFNKLQAQDLGKVGAIQDLLRGIEKLLPRQTEVSVQPIAVQSVMGANVAALLDRGNMALEDGDWAKADSFFEDVLNNDSKNAQAYLGKTLAMERCRTIDAFARQRKDASQNVRGQTLKLQPEHAHVDEIVKRFSLLPGFVDLSRIRKLYDFDLSYHSDVAERNQQYRNEENYWSNHKQLSRAEKFATGLVAENLANEKKALFAVFADRVKKAEAAEAAAREDVWARYTAHLQQADQQAEKIYNDGLAHREAYYQGLLQIAQKSSNVQKLTATAESLYRLGDYKDSKNLAEHCCKRAAEERAKLEQEAEAKRMEAQRAAAKRKKRNTVIGIITAVALAAAIAFVVVLIKVIVPNNRYNAAEAKLQSGEFLEAKAVFSGLGDYKDAQQAARYAWMNYLYRCAHTRNREVKNLLEELRPSAENQKPAEKPGNSAAAEEITPTEEVEIDRRLLSGIFEFLNSSEKDTAMLQTETTKVLLTEKLAQSYEIPEDIVQEIIQLYLKSGGNMEKATEPETVPEPFTVDISLSENDLLCMELYGYVLDMCVAMGDYRDSAKLAETIREEMADIPQMHYAAICVQGEAYLAAEEFEKAIAVFDALAEHMDTSEKVMQARQAQQEKIEQARAANYASAEEMVAQQNYEAAYAIFMELNTYNDSADRAIACATLAAQKAEAEEQWLTALKWYEVCNDTEGMNRVEYRYIQANYNNTDEVTFAFLKALTQIDYQDTQDLYDTLYKQNFTIRVNMSSTDTESHNTSIDVASDYDDIYVHVLYSGGTPNEETIKVSAIVEYYDYEDGEWFKWSTSYIDSLTVGKWRYEDFIPIGRSSFRFVLKNLDTGEQIAVVPIYVY